MFNKSGLDVVPHWVRYGGISLMVISPLLAVIYMCVFDDEGEEALAEANRERAEEEAR